MGNYCYYNGKTTSFQKVKISPYDIGFLRGYGVFDVMCTQNGKLFLFNEHWKRFQNSAKELGLTVPMNKNEFKKHVDKLLAKNGFKKSIVRTILTGGVSGDAMSPGKETFCILIEKFIPLPKNIFTDGASVVTLDYQRDFPRAKITNYIAAIKNRNNKKKNGSLETVYVNEGKVFEASTSNLFIFKNNILVTPQKGILLGTTRNLVINLAKKIGYEVQEREVKLKELYSANEVFLTAVNKDIVPIVKIDKKKVDSGRVGENTKKLMKTFKEFTEKY